MTYSVIIPIHNLFTRGYDRLHLQLISLIHQTRKPLEIFIPDSTPDPAHFAVVDSIIDSIDTNVKITHFHVETGGVFNMPMKFNRALERCQSDYVMCTGADFLYSPNLFELYRKYEGENRFLLKVVWNLPNITVTPEQVAKWKIPGKKKIHPAGQGADGIQYAHIDFFKSVGGYDERMQGWGGMDNDMHKRAEKSENIECLWIQKGQIFHIWHKVEKGGKEDMKQTHKNWNILDNDKSINRGFIK